MPQAVSPRRPSGSAFPFTSPGQRSDRKPEAGSFRARTNPREWDHKRVARYYEKHGPPATSPLLARIVLDNKIDGHALCDTPEDMLSEVVADHQLAEDLRITAHDLRAKAGLSLSPSSRVPRVQDIAQSLANLSEPSVPSLSASPEVVEEHPPSPHTPPPWDWPDDEEVQAPQYLEFDGNHTFLHFGSPSTALHLLQPLVTMSPEAAFELSALEVPDAHGAAEFASADAQEVEEEVAESDVDAVGSGDHPGLSQTQGDLPSRQDGSSSTSDEQHVFTVPVEVSEPPAPAAQRPKLRLNSSASIPSRPGSCPPLVPLVTYVPPRAPAVPEKVYVEKAVQAGSDVPATHASVAVQTRSLAEAGVQAEPEAQPNEEDLDVPTEASLTTAVERAHSEQSVDGHTETREDDTLPGSPGEPATSEPKSTEPTHTPPTLPAPPSERAAPHRGEAATSQEEGSNEDGLQPMPEAERRKARKATLASNDKRRDASKVPSQEPSPSQQGRVENPENGVSSRDDQLSPVHAPSVPTAAAQALLRGSSLPLASPSPITPGQQSELRADVMEPDPRKHRLAGPASSTVGGRHDSSWAGPGGKSPPPIPAAPITTQSGSVQRVASEMSSGKPNASSSGRGGAPTRRGITRTQSTSAAPSTFVAPSTSGAPPANAWAMNRGGRPAVLNRTSSTPDDIELSTSSSHTTRAASQAAKRAQSQDSRKARSAFQDTRTKLSTQKKLSEEGGVPLRDMQGTQEGHLDSTKANTSSTANDSLPAPAAHLTKTNADVKEPVPLSSSQPTAALVASPTGVVQNEGGTSPATGTTAAKELRKDSDTKPLAPEPVSEDAGAASASRDTRSKPSTQAKQSEESETPLGDIRGIRGNRLDSTGGNTLSTANGSRPASAAHPTETNVDVKKPVPLSLSQPSSSSQPTAAPAASSTEVMQNKGGTFPATAATATEELRNDSDSRLSVPEPVAEAAGAASAGSSKDSGVDSTRKVDQPLTSGKNQPKDSASNPPSTLPAVPQTTAKTDLTDPDTEEGEDTTRSGAGVSTDTAQNLPVTTAPPTISTSAPSGDKSKVDSSLETSQSQRHIPADSRERGEGSHEGKGEDEGPMGRTESTLVGSRISDELNAPLADGALPKENLPGDTRKTTSASLDESAVSREGAAAASVGAVGGTGSGMGAGPPVPPKSGAAQSNSKTKTEQPINPVHPDDPRGEVKSTKQPQQPVPSVPTPAADTTNIRASQLAETSATDAAGTVATSSQTKVAGDAPEENDPGHDFSMVSQEEAAEAETDQGTSGAGAGGRESEDWQDLGNPDQAEHPDPSNALSEKRIEPKRAMSSNPVEFWQVQRASSNARPSSAGGLNPQATAFGFSGQRSLPETIYSPHPLREDKKAGLLHGLSFIPGVQGLVDAISPSAPETPVTPGDDGEAEEGFVELDEAAVADMTKDEKERYRKKLKKKRQAQSKKQKSAVMGSLYS